MIEAADATAAVDSTGLETRHASAHFRRRVGRTETTHAAWPKLTAVFHTASHLIVGAVPARGPSQDLPDFAPAVRRSKSPVNSNFLAFLGAVRIKYSILQL